MSKVLCTNPNHYDTIPSMQIYHDGGFCFVCGYTDKSLVDADTGKQKENIQESIDRICSLPVINYRGLHLHADLQGAYILWPDCTYYKKRMFSDDGPRYIGPKGVVPPLLILKGRTDISCIIIEGEINALSLKKSCPSLYIISPGSASNFPSQATNLLTIFRTFVIIVDKDPAGVSAGIELKNKLILKGARAEVIATAPDYNEIFQKEGPQAVSNKFREDLGL